jgi:hypothetical protein
MVNMAGFAGLPAEPKGLRETDAHTKKGRPDDRPSLELFPRTENQLQLAIWLRAAVTPLSE